MPTADSSSNGQAVGEPTAVDDYIAGIRNEFAAFRGYFVKRIRAHRVGRLVVIVAAVLVPVLAPIDGVPRAVLGALGALAAIAEGVQQLYQFRQSAINAMQAGNALERELNLYMTGVEPYVGREAEAFPLLVHRVEAIRGAASGGFLQLWQQDPSDRQAERLPVGR